MKRNYHQEALNKYGSPLTTDQFNEFVESVITASQYSPSVSAMEDGWVKVEDKLPEPHKCVVGWHSKQLMPVVCFIQNGIKTNYWSLVTGCFYTDGMETIQSVTGSITHWHPLPPPPSK